MGRDQSGGSLGIFSLLGIAVLYFIVRKFSPTIAAALLITGGVIVVLILLVVGIVLYLAFHKPKEHNSTDTEEDAAVILQKGRTGLLEIRKLGLKVKNQKIRLLTEEICKTVERIFSVLKEKPDQIPQVRKMLNYYLPTLGKILMKYRRLEENGIPAGDIADNTISCLENIRVAMDKQYVSLFDDDILDLTVEMEVLTMMCKRDGLLTDEEFQANDSEYEITLTL